MLTSFIIYSAEMNGVPMLFRTLRVSTGGRADAYANGSEEYASSPFPFCIVYLATVCLSPIDIHNCLQDAQDLGRVADRIELAV
jgi:hypothetical protein